MSEAGNKIQAESGVSGGPSTPAFPSRGGGEVVEALAKLEDAAPSQTEIYSGCQSAVIAERLIGYVEGTKATAALIRAILSKAEPLTKEQNNAA